LAEPEADAPEVAEAIAPGPMMMVLLWCPKGSEEIAGRADRRRHQEGIRHHVHPLGDAERSAP
jgi:hypothetical protein